MPTQTLEQIWTVAPQPSDHTESDLAQQIVGVKQKGAVAGFFGVEPDYIQVAPPWTETPEDNPQVVVGEEAGIDKNSTAEKKEEIKYILTNEEEKIIAETMKDRKNVEKSLRAFLDIKGDEKLTKKQNKLREFATVMAYGYIHGKPTIRELINPASIDNPLVDEARVKKSSDKITQSEGFGRALEETKKRIVNSDEKKIPELTEEEKQARTAHNRQISQRSIELQNTKIEMQNEVTQEINTTMDKYTPEEGEKIIEEAQKIILNTPLNEVLTVEAVRQYMVILKAAEEFNRTRTMHRDPFSIQAEDLNRAEVKKQVQETLTPDLLERARAARERMNRPRPTTVDTGASGEEDDFLARVRNAKSRAGITEPIITTEEQKGDKDDARIRKREPVPTT